MNTGPSTLTESSRVDPADFRARFPLLGRQVHLATCTLGARSKDLDAALAHMLDEMATGAAWGLFEKQVDAARRGFADLICARQDQIALVPSASVGAYQIASTLEWAGRPRLVTTDADFPSIAHVWLAQRPRGADVVYVDPADYLSVVDERTKLLSVPMTTYQNGIRLPVPDIVSGAHSLGAQVFVDAYQAVGNEPVDVERLGCDYLVAGSMKYLLGLPGLAFLYVRSPAAADRDPRLTGWFGRVDPFAFDPRRLDFPPQATRFETGTPAVLACYAANAGLGMIARLDLEAVRQHIRGLTEHAAGRLAELGECVRMPVDADARGAHIGLVDPEPTALAAWLVDRNIAVSPRGDVVRLSFHYYNNTEDVAVLCDEIRTYRSLRDNPNSPYNVRASGGIHVDS